MKDLIEEPFGKSPLDASESARAAMRTPLRRRFYKHAAVADVPGGFSFTLDGKPMRTPARALLSAPHRDIAQAMADEWNAQGEHIDPASMPLTRLGNSVIDGVAARMSEVADDVLNYVGTDMVFYRADGPQALIDRQNEHWNPLVDWASARFGGRFVLAEGIVHVAQPQAAIEGISKALPRHPWTLGALHLATTLTGSALIALALAAGQIDEDAAWQAAHVDEDWNFSVWGVDEEVMRKRKRRLADLSAAALVLSHFPLEG